MAITGNELRIDNIVKDGIVRAITHRHVTVYNTKTKSTDDRLAWLIEPEPLTEKWLLKFGYWRDNVDLHFTQMVSPITIENNSQPRKLAYSIFLSNARDSGESFLRVIEHVHQLQNLYFSLTGEELTIFEK